MDLLNKEDMYHRPLVCEKCGGVMVFKGVGEYHCEDCKFVAYDDYGKARLYIERHRGATAAEVAEHTGVAQKTIRQMLKENKLEIATDSAVFLKCEICGIPIRGGRMCAKCEKEYHAHIESKERNKKLVQGFGKAASEEDGAKRYRRTF